MRLVRVTPGPDGIADVSITGVEAAKQVLLDWPGPAPVGSAPERGQATILDLGVAAGTARWQLTSFEPNTECIMHRTHTVDAHTVLTGELELLLTGGRRVEVHPGDLVLVAGVDHAWRSGGDGALTSATLLGLPPDTDQPSTSPAQIERLTWTCTPAETGA